MANEIIEIAKKVEHIKRYIGSIETDPKRPDAAIMKNRALKGMNDTILLLSILNRRMQKKLKETGHKVQLCPNCRLILETKREAKK